MKGPKGEIIKCEVCGNEPAVVSCCVPGVPISMVYCVLCLDANAHPWSILVANTVCLGSYEQSVDWWKQMIDDTCARLGKTLDEFKADVEKGVADMALELKKLDDNYA